MRLTSATASSNPHTAPSAAARLTACRARQLSPAALERAISAPLQLLKKSSILARALAVPAFHWAATAARTPSWVGPPPSAGEGRSIRRPAAALSIRSSPVWWSTRTGWHPMLVLRCGPPPSHCSSDGSLRLCQLEDGGFAPGIGVPGFPAPLGIGSCQASIQTNKWGCRDHTHCSANSFCQFLHKPTGSAGATYFGQCVATVSIEPAAASSTGGALLGHAIRRKPAERSLLPRRLNDTGCETATP